MEADNDVIKTGVDGAVADTEAAHPAPSVDAETERRVVRKLDTHLVPLVAFLCTAILFLSLSPTYH